MIFRLDILYLLQEGVVFLQDAVLFAGCSSGILLERRLQREKDLSESKLSGNLWTW